MAEVKPALTRCFWFCAEALSKGPGRRPLQDRIHDDATGPSANIRLTLPAVPAAWGLSTRFHRHSTTHFGSHTFYPIWLTKKL